VDGALKQESGQKVKNIEISVDACAELGGQVYEVIHALRHIYQLSGLRRLTYVDTYQGFREKSDGTTPDTLFAFGEPHTRYGRFVYNSRDWHAITNTHECQQFADTLGRKILPTMTAPIFDAVEEITREIQRRAFVLLQQSGRDRIGDKTIAAPEDIEIAIEIGIPKSDKGTRRKIVDPIVKQALDESMGGWRAIVKADPLLSMDKKNANEQMLIALIAGTQECKAIAAALLYRHNPEAAKRMQKMPDLISASADMPSLATLRASAHQFAGLTFPKDGSAWLQPEVQQAVRFTGLWPWSRKPFMHETHHHTLRGAHRNTADRAAVSYFLNHLSAKPHAPDTLYMLVTHDGPLMDDFINFASGIEKRAEKIKESRVKGAGKLKRTVYYPMCPDAYEKRELRPPEPSTLPYSAMLTGAEFVKFVEREQERVKKKFPMTPELTQAMDTLTNALKLLKPMVARDKQAHGLMKDGTFEDRMRKRAIAMAEASPEPGRL
jgi:hypothetical protein